MSKPCPDSGRAPGKAANLAFEDDPELEFEFFLADRLGLTLAAMRAQVTQQEFVYWSRFHGRRAQQKELAAKMAGA